VSFDEERFKTLIYYKLSFSLWHLSAHDMDRDGDDIQKCFVWKGQELGPSPAAVVSTIKWITKDAVESKNRVCLQQFQIAIAGCFPFGGRLQG